MLQSELTGSEGIDALVRALHANKSAGKTYRSCLALNYKLTNPPAKKDLLASLASLDDGSFSPPHDGVHFFPASVSRETELMKRLDRGKPMPADFNLMDELIRRIRSRDIDLTPRADSGWYDHQTWALAPLVLPDQTPEAKHLRLNDHYRVALTKLFKGSLALARETHVKQLDVPVTGESPPADIRPKVYIRPELSAEPLATMYLRRALSYRFVRSVLEETFGRPALKKMYRHTASGPVDVNLDEELLGMEALFHGAHVTVCRQIGLSEDKEAKVGSGQGPAADAARFLAWGANPRGDLDLGRDARMMVPVFHSAQSGKTKVWVFLGWTTQRVEIGYVRQPTAQVFDADGNRVTDDTGPELIYYGERKTIATPVMAEVYVTKLLNREEFREHCDIYAKPSAILNNLK
jgi:hypothetical protein